MDNRNRMVKEFVPVIISGYRRYADISTILSPKKGEQERRVRCYCSPGDRKPACTIPISQIKQVTVF